MEREVSLLRCSKLSCYTDFNRMVQAIARNGGEGVIPGTRPQTGTGAEYNFFTTLVLMLKQVISNTDSVTQERELQQVYEWFCLNKPLIKSKTKPSQRKPKVSITNSDRMDSVSFPFPELGRPQTAPASLYHAHRSFSEDPGMRRSTRGKPSSALKRRPTFTAMYVSRSLCGGLDLVGQTFDQLQLQQKPQLVSDEGVRSPETVDPSRLDECTPGVSRESRDSSVSVVELPSPDLLPNSSPGQRPATSRPVSIATVFSMVPCVAAQMALERELNEEYQNNRKRILSGHSHQPSMMRNRSDFMQHRHLVNTPTDSPTTTQPLKPLGYSEFDSTSNSGVANEWELDLLKETSKDGNESRATVASLQASPSRHENKPNEQKETDTSTQLVTERSRKESGDITKPSAGPDERQDPQRVSQPPTLPVRVQEAMVDMKVVNSRHNLLSQVSLKQRDSPRAHDKQATHDNVGMNLHIEGLAMRLSPENSGQRQNKFITSHKEHVSSSPARAHTTRQEGKSKTGSLTIRPVSLQQHSPRISTSASLVKREPDNDISTETITNRDHGTENVEDIAHAHETHQGTEVSSTPSNASHSIEGQENEYGEDSTTNSQKNDSLPSSTVDQSSKEEIEEGSGSQNEENSSPSTVETAAKNDPSNISSSVSQVTQSGSVSDMPKSPIVLVKESSPSPTRLRSSRPVSYHQKSLSFRLASPINVVSLSFPTEEMGSGRQRSRMEVSPSPSSDTKTQTPTIIAGFNRKRYRRVRSPRAAEQYKMS